MTPPSSLSALAPSYYATTVNNVQDWQQPPEALDRSPGDGRPGQHTDLSPSPKRALSSPGTEPESQDAADRSPGGPADQPAGIDSDDNFEVSDDADEQQVMLTGIVHLAVPLPCCQTCFASIHAVDGTFA